MKHVARRCVATDLVRVQLQTARKRSSGASFASRTAEPSLCQPLPSWARFCIVPRQFLALLAGTVCCSTCETFRITLQARRKTKTGSAPLMLWPSGYSRSHSAKQRCPLGGSRVLFRGHQGFLPGSLAGWIACQRCSSLWLVKPRPAWPSLAAQLSSQTPAHQLFGGWCIEADDDRALFVHTDSSSCPCKLYSYRRSCMQLIVYIEL